MSPREASEREIRRAEARSVLILPPGASYEQLERILGDTHGRFLLATDGREQAIEQAKTEYVHDRIDLDEFELRVETALRGRLISQRAALNYYDSLPDPSLEAWR